MEYHQRKNLKVVFLFKDIPPECYMINEPSYHFACKGTYFLGNMYLLLDNLVVLV